MKHNSKLSARIMIATVIGLLLATVTTKISYTCAPLADDPSSHCTAFEKAIMHPSDLINNKQDSLTELVGTLAISSLVSFALISIYVSNKKKA
jgi:hypothetical protein